MSCATSGFAAAPPPTGNYAFDVHIDTGIGHLMNNVWATTQDSVQWAWMALVTVVRCLLVALEWCYSLSLLGRAAMEQAGAAMRVAGTVFTIPALSVACAFAAVLVAYRGLVRRRVAQTLGEVAAMVAMMVCGLAVMAYPAGTVGVLARWADDASAGALGALAAGTPAHPQATLAEQMGAVFADVIGGPWCYMEFGDVRWCRDPALLDGQLRAAALRIAREARSLARGSYPSGAEHGELLASARLVEGARSNGALFLALPANGPARNSINDRGSLLSVLCGGSSEATRCRGPTAEMAQFRTEQGTGRRILGLAVVWLGALGMVALLGWIASQLVRAAVLTLLHLLLVPVAVVAPALGDGGRAAFRAWSARLLGALAAKLVYSLMLGAVLVSMRILATLDALGWWLQWLLSSSLWWIVLRHRHELLAMMRWGEPTTASGAPPRRGVVARMRDRVVQRATDGALRGAGRLARARPVHTPQGPLRGMERERHRRAWTRGRADRQALRLLEAEREQAFARVSDAPQAQEAISVRRAQLQRIERALAHGGSWGDERDRTGRGAPPASGRGPREGSVPDGVRRARLRVRAERVGAEIEGAVADLTASRRLIAEGIEQGAKGGFSDARLSARRRLLDEQAELPAKGRPDGAGRRRDYRALAGLAGVAAQDWERLEGRRRLEAIVAIDGALAERRRLGRVARGAATGDPSFPGQTGRRRLAHRLAGESRPSTDRLPPRRPQAQGSGGQAGALKRDGGGAMADFLAEARRQREGGARPVPLSKRSAAEPPPGGAAAAAEARARLRRQLGARGYDGDDAEEGGPPAG